MPTEDSNLVSKDSQTTSYTAELVETDDGPSLKRHVSLIHAISIIVTSIVGSGIFITPQMVYLCLGSVGASLVMWAATGVYILLLSWCYMELATLMPDSGGEYVYNYSICGEWQGFLAWWVAYVVVVPASCGAIAQTAGLYLATAVGLPDNALLCVLIADLIITTVFFVNINSTYASLILNTVLTVAKMAALVFIIITGIYYLLTGQTQYMENPFEGTTTDLAMIVTAFLDCVFSYTGWEMVVNISEEIIAPERNLPIAMLIGLLLVTSVYVLTNLAYFVVLSNYDLMKSSAVALSLGDKAFGTPVVGSIIAFFVALSCTGTLNSSYLTGSRLVFACSRQKQIPSCLAMIGVNNGVPIMSIILCHGLFVAFLMIPDLSIPVRIASFSAVFKVFISIISLLVLKWQQPDNNAPIKIPWILAGFAAVCQVVIMGLALYADPWVNGAAVIICAMAFPVYGIILQCKKSEVVGCAAIGWCIEILQKMFMIAPAETDEDVSTVAKKES